VFLGGFEFPKELYFVGKKLCPELCLPLALPEQARATRRLVKCRGLSSAGHSCNAALVPAKSLILRACNPWAQEVWSSNLNAPTIPTLSLPPIAIIS